MEKLKEIQKELHKINFGKGSIIEMQMNDGDYSLKDIAKDSKENNHNHKYAKTQSCDCCCNKCSEYQDKLLRNDNNQHKYFFTNVSHGTHMLDFVEAHNQDKNAHINKINEMNNWSKKPVLFVMENPANSSSGIFDIESNEIGKKRPAKNWYWISVEPEEESSVNGNEKFVYPNYFGQKEFGRLVYSIMNTFKIANGYLTNMVKCGIGYYKTEKNPCLDKYTTTDKYNEKIVNKCVSEILYKEIEALCGDNKGQDIITFAFGERTYNRLCKLKKENLIIYKLPHPSCRISDFERKCSLFIKIMQGLKQNGFYDDYNEILTFESICPECSEIIEIERNLHSFGQNKNIKFQYNIDYTPGEWGYELEYKCKENLVIPDRLVLKYGLKDDEITSYKNCWISYCFKKNEVMLYVSKNSKTRTPNKYVENNFESYKIYNIMTEFLKSIGINNFVTKNEA